MEEIIARLFDPAALLVNMVLGMIINVVYFYLLQRVLPPRSKAQYWQQGSADIHGRSYVRWYNRLNERQHDIHRQHDHPVLCF